jgi:hypothetical protein
VEVTRSLFSVQQVPLGVEHSLETGPRPCGFWVTDERARFVRRGVTEMLNSRDEWEPSPPIKNATLGVALVRENDRWRRALTLPRMLEGGTGNLCRLRSPARYGRELPIATILPSGDITPVKWLKKAMREKQNNAQPAFAELRRGTRPTKEPSSARGIFSRNEFEGAILPLVSELVRPGIIVDRVTRGRTVTIRIDYSDVPIQAHIDSSGKALMNPPERENLPEVCRTCDQLEHDRSVPIMNSPAYAWRYLDLVEADGTPTTRGIIFSFFHGGEGLAIAAALEDETYPISDLVFDLANVRAGPRFSGEDAPMGGRLGILCQRLYGRADYPGYLTMGVPMQYGAGASEVMRELVADPRSKHKLIGNLLRHGDIERALVEWRSLLHRIVTAPAYPLPRWNELKRAAGELIEKTVSPTVIDLAGLLPVQQRRIS